MRSVPHIDKMEGVTFVIAPDGIIREIGATNWNAFANANGAPELQAENVIGRNLFDYIEGPQVQDQFKRVLDKISEDPNWSWVLPYRCDAPDRKRTMCQSLRPIFSGRTCSGFIFQSVEQHVQQRPPIHLFNFKMLRQLSAEQADLPVVLMCSWCQRVQCDSVSGKDWLDAEDYYAAGGRTNVQLSHGICDDCLQTTNDPFHVESRHERSS